MKNNALNAGSFPLYANKMLANEVVNGEDGPIQCGFKKSIEVALFGTKHFRTETRVKAMDGEKSHTSTVGKEI